MPLHTSGEICVHDDRDAIKGNLYNRAKDLCVFKHGETKNVVRVYVAVNQQKKPGNLGCGFARTVGKMIIGKYYTR